MEHRESQHDAGEPTPLSMAASQEAQNATPSRPADVQIPKEINPLESKEIPAAAGPTACPPPSRSMHLTQLAKTPGPLFRTISSESST